MKIIYQLNLPSLQSITSNYSWHRRFLVNVNTIFSLQNYLTPKKNQNLSHKLLALFFVATFVSNFAQLDIASSCLYVLGGFAVNNFIANSQNQNGNNRFFAKFLNFLNSSYFSKSVTLLSIYDNSINQQNKNFSLGPVNISSSIAPALYIMAFGSLIIDNAKETEILNQFQHDKKLKFKSSFSKRLQNLIGQFRTDIVSATFDYLSKGAINPFFAFTVSFAFLVKLVSKDSFPDKLEQISKANQSNKTAIIKEKTTKIDQHKQQPQKWTDKIKYLKQSTGKNLGL